MTKQTIEFLCDSHNGVFIPQIMIDRLVEAGWKGIQADDVTTIKLGPDCEWYWEAWETVLNNATYEDEDGNEWRLYQDGDLFTYNQDHIFED
ncbi:MAG: hypothetical protein ACRCYP_01830 [Alphaproteobacteria bacterium]